jgi:glycosyltransferase involved in cell wall biosynthesis
MRVAPTIVVLFSGEERMSSFVDATRPAENAAGLQTDVRVASVPSSHVYIRHIGREETDAPTAPRAIRLPDPHPTIPGRSAVSQWWPPKMLEPEWIAENIDTFDLYHLQFGFDAVAPDRLRDVIRELRKAHKPIVYTVHDLRNPHHADRTAHDAQLDVLVHEADALVTLTNGAAAEIRERWGREARVIPHPHVVDFETMERIQLERYTTPTPGFRVGLHAKSLRANMNPMRLISTIADAIAELPDATFQVDGHTDVLTPSGERYDPELTNLLTQYADRGLIDLRIHDFFTDEELWSYLASLDASVLPYRFGTHSGWLEACRDLGTRVIAPTCGYYAEQAPVLSYGNDDSGFDGGSLVTAITDAYRLGRQSPLSVPRRRAQRSEIARSHEHLYAGLLA